ncbi:hypothetical protein RJ639_020949 [Escallonia herrerae]|uniref:Uncharacterized protein n=1 Tax=Escallonia herrerae TaxID=1293975 RepID=A0AA89AF92_9ASTE|nr:hypothetical protein RJ639_020949 [Escallonia herrerae]
MHLAQFYPRMFNMHMPRKSNYSDTIFHIQQHHQGSDISESRLKPFRFAAAVFGNPKNFTPFHGPVLQYGVDPFQTNACAGDSGTIPTENNPGSGLSSVCQEDKNRLSPVMVFIPNFIPGRNVSPGN